MSWAKIDDRANEHRKQLAAGPEACWLWACGLMYANRQPARDGFIPEAMLGMLFPFKNPKKLAEKLVEAELWHRVTGGYQIHEFESWNQGARQTTDEERAKGRARAAKSYEQRRAKKPDSSGEDSSGSSPEEEPKNDGSSEPRAHTRVGSSPPTAQIPTPAASTAPKPPEAAAADEEAIEAKAKRVYENPHLADFSEAPQTWPALVAFANDAHAALRLAAPDLGHYATDAAVRVLVELFATTNAEKRSVVLKQLPVDPWCNDRERRRLGVALLRPQVVRGLLASATESKPVPRRVPAPEPRPIGPILDAPPPDLVEQLTPRRPPPVPVRSREEQLAALREEAAKEAAGG
jgi:hypothetical protein